jgi:hypothetical protein
MANPFNKFKNSKLYFEIGTGNLTEDAAGNPIDQTTILTLDAFLTPQGQSKLTDEIQKGLTTSQYLLKGFITSSVNLSGKLYPDMVTVPGSQTNYRGQKGSFRLIAIPQSPVALATEKTGLKVLGVFSIAGGL